MDEADEVAPVVTVLDRGERLLAVEAPDFVQDRLEPDPVLIHCPQFDGCVGEGSGDGLQQRPQFFLNASCSAGSACTCRGRGLRRWPSRRTR